MKTTRTKEDAWKAEALNKQGEQYFYRGWERALASVVEEPVLTRGQVLTAIIEWETAEPREMNDGLLDRLFAAGRIPASKPTPQQEGGLTREWLFEQFGKFHRDETTSDPVMDGILSRHAQALEAKEAEVTDKYEKVCMDLYKSMQDQGFDVEHHYQDQISTLRAELAEAKKGRYALGDRMEATTDGQLYWKGVVGFLPDLVSPALPWKGHRVISPNPTIDHMATELVNFWLRDVNDVVPGLKEQMISTMKYSTELETIWQRDCGGGVE